MTAPNSNSTAIAPRTEEKKGIAGVLARDDAREMITPLLRGASYDQIMSEVRLAVSKNPEIALCTPASIITAVAEAVSSGGIIGKDVHLVPFNVNVAPKGAPKKWEKRLQSMTDYKFEAKLIVGTGAARAVDAYCVFEHETFEYEAGSSPFIRHVPIVDPKVRGRMIAVYAVARLSHSMVKIHVMSIDEVDVVREKFSRQWNDGPCPPWYAMKTAIRRLAKLLPSNPKLAALLAKFRPEQPDDPDAEPVAVIEGPAASILQEPPRRSALAARGHDVADVTSEYLGGDGSMPRIVPGQAADGPSGYGEESDAEIREFDQRLKDEEESR